MVIICCWARLRLLEFYSLKGKTGASRRKRFSFSLMSARFTNRCLSVATIAAIDLPIAAAVCLVALSYRLGGADPGLGPSANQPGMPATPTSCRAAPAWQAAMYALPFKRDVFFCFFLAWMAGLQCLSHPSREIARKRPFNRRHRRLSMLAHPFDVSIISMLIQMDAGWIWFIPCLHDLTVKIGGSRELGGYVQREIAHQVYCKPLPLFRASTVGLT